MERFKKLKKEPNTQLSLEREDSSVFQSNCEAERTTRQKLAFFIHNHVCRCLFRKYNDAKNESKRQSFMVDLDLPRVVMDGGASVLKSIRDGV